MSKCPHCGKDIVTPKAGTTYTPEFEEFWFAYETRKRTPAASKPEAMKAWKQTSVTRPDMAALLMTVKAYHAYIDKTDTPACHPATWLRQERWSGFVAKSEAEKRPIFAHESWPRDIAEALAQKIGPAKFNTWLGSSKYATGPIPAVIVSSGFRKDYIQQNLARDMYEVLGKFHILLEPG